MITIDEMATITLSHLAAIISTFSKGIPARDTKISYVTKLLVN